MTVKKPTGFKDEDLSRPVIEIRDFMNDDLLYEIYNFGSDTIVNPVGKAQFREKGNRQQGPRSKKSFDQRKGGGKNKKVGIMIEKKRILMKKSTMRMNAKIHSKAVKMMTIFL